MDDSTNRAADLISDYESLAKDRGTLNSHLEEIADRVIPRYSGSFIGGSARVEGEKRTQKMVDATAPLALTRFAAAMESMLTPSGSRWHTLTPDNNILKRHRTVRLWFDTLTDNTFSYRYSPRANFASQKHEDYMALGSFGTGCLFVDPLYDRINRVNRGLRYSAIHLGEIYFKENFQGIIDTAYRKFHYTVRQAIQFFGEESLPEELLSKAKIPGSANTKYEFIHCVKPREDAEGYDPERLDMKGMPFVSYYVSCTGKKIIKEGGYNTFPYSISRYVKAPGEVYGRSPAMLALPSIKVLNEEKRTVLKQGHRAVDPVLLTHDDGILDGFSLRPGALNPGGVTADGKPLVHALKTGNLALAHEMMQDERAIINDFFLVTLFQILVETPTMTATEVIERAREKGALLSPTMGRQQSEALGPMIEREVDILISQGLMPPMPRILKEAQGEYKIEYDSPLSRMAKAESVAGLFRTVDYFREYVAITGDQTPLDHIDWDGAMPDVMEAQAIKARWRRSEESIAQMRKSRMEKEQMQTAVEAAPAVASVINSGKSAGGRKG